jgi:predicted acylesterase/phospholipase RssA
MKLTGITSKGGGIRGACEIGSYSVLEEEGLTAFLERTAGTSVGSLVALMIALRMTAAQMKKVMDSLNFGSLQSGFNIFRELTREGLYDNKHLLTFIQSITTPILGPDATFADMRRAGFMDFRCVASVPALQTIQVFSADTTPNTKIDWACLTSAAIPGFFPKMRLPGFEYDMVDGGLIENYFITAFDKDHPPSETVGLFVYNPAAPKPLPTDTLPQMAIACFESAMASQDVIDMGDPATMSRTILIPTKYASTDFHVVQADKDEMFQEGRDASKQYLATL